MATFSRIQTATRGRSGDRDRRGRFVKHTGIVVEGVDVVASRFALRAATIGPKAGQVAVDAARRAADAMRSNIAVDKGHVRDSITSDTEPTEVETGVYADAGATHFVARFLEEGTVRTSPQPFARPAADQVQPGFVKAIKDLM